MDEHLFAPNPIFRQHAAICAPASRGAVLADPDRMEASGVEFTVPLKQNHVFRRLYAKGESAVGSFVVVYAKRNGSRSNRLGITTGLKLGRAVDRNRARRRIRETYRLQERKLKQGYDIVIVARTQSIDGDFAAMNRSFLSQCRRLKLLREDKP